MFNGSKFNGSKFNSTSTFTERVIYYYSFMINLVHTIKEKMTIKIDNQKINLNPRKYK